MKKINNKKILIAVLVILIVVISAFLGRILALNKDTTKITGLVTNIYNGVDYNPRLIKTLEEYETIVKDNNLNLSDKDKLTAKDFKNNDFIVDFIPYSKGLEVSDININLSDEGVTLNYQVNMDVKDNTQLIIYFIPITKGQIKDFVLANRHFDYS